MQESATSYKPNSYKSGAHKSSAHKSSAHKSSAHKPSAYKPSAYKPSAGNVMCAGNVRSITAAGNSEIAAKLQMQQTANSAAHPSSRVSHILERTPDPGIYDMIAKARKLATAAQNIDELKKYVEEFDGCALKNFAANTVFADGTRDAKVLLVGEAPGANEDKYGIPFCGESGKLLDKMLETINLARDKNTYITNTIFWRPPGNRRPTQDEIDVCRPFVEKHIALIDPELIILVGATAATSLLGKHEGISKIRRNSYQYNNDYLSSTKTVMALFHPAYLLRQPSQKKETWFDLIKIQQFLQEKQIQL